MKRSIRGIFATVLIIVILCPTVRAADEVRMDRILLVTLDENFEVIKIVESR